MEIDFRSFLTEGEVHNELRKRICIDYLPLYPQELRRAFQTFKANCRIHLSIAEQGLQEPDAIFEALEKRGKIRVGQYDILKTLIGDADDRILPLIKAAENRIGELRFEQQQAELQREEEEIQIAMEKEDLR